MKSKKMQICAVLIFGIPILLFLSLSSCKNFGMPDYQLSITVESGVEGAPESGVYSYQELSAIDYNYIPLDALYTVEVMVNGGRWAAQGTFVMYTNLEVVARIIDIRDTWVFTIQRTDSTDEEPEFNVTFSGEGLLSGSFTDDRGYSGTWNIAGQVITMIYNDWLGQEFIGSIVTMSGDWNSEGSKIGTWSANKEEEE